MRREFKKIQHRFDELSTMSTLKPEENQTIKENLETLGIAVLATHQAYQ